jgi:parallel beta-helix repeat protein
VSDCDNGITVNGTRGTLLFMNAVSNCTHDGIELLGGSGTVVAINLVRGSGNDGIFVDAASAGNVLAFNTASGSGNFDAEDLSAGHGTAETANWWVANTFVRDNRGGRLGR